MKLCPNIMGEIWERLNTDMKTLQGLMDNVNTMMVSLYASEFCTHNQTKFYDHQRFRRLIDNRIMVLKVIGTHMDTENTGSNLYRNIGDILT